MCLNPLYSRDFEHQNRSLFFLSYNRFSLKSGFQFMLKMLISRISDKKLILETSTKRFHQNCVQHLFKSRLIPHVGGQYCPDSVRIYRAMSVNRNLEFSVRRVFECPHFEIEPNFDRQTPHSKPGQNPDSTIRRRLPYTKTPLFMFGMQTKMRISPSDTSFTAISGHGSKLPVLTQK